MRIKKLSKEGFTLVELMIVVAIVGVLAALAIYGVQRYVLNAKTTEARAGVGRMAKDAVNAYSKEAMAADVLPGGEQADRTYRLCAGAPAAVPSSPPKAAKYQSNPSDWQDGDADTGFPCLKFSMNDPQYFSYNYQQSGSGTSAEFTAIANGDLDGDGSTSAFTMRGGVLEDNGELVARAAPNMQETDPEE